MDFNVVIPFYQAIGVMLSMSILAIVGTFTSLQKKELAGDVISHAVLPGIVLAFIAMHVKNAFYLSIGALGSGMMAMLLIDYLSYTNPKIKKDTSMALVLASFFGFGIMLLSFVQNNKEYEEQSGLKDFLLGNVVALSRQDVVVFACLTAVVLMVLFVFFHEWQLLCFDRSFAITVGMPVHRLDFLFRCITVMAIVLGIQTVGVVLVTALLITPVVTGFFWTKKLKVLLAIASFVACVSGVGGMYCSYYIGEMPTGPCIVLISVLLLLISCLFAPGEGFFPKKWYMYLYGRRILQENLLKMFFELGQLDDGYEEVLDLKILKEYRKIPVGKIRKGMEQLCAKRLAFCVDRDKWRLTKDGCRYGKRIMERHLLWEAYLERFLKIDSTHVHDDAEAIEHLITPQIEAMLRRVLSENKEGA